MYADLGRASDSGADILPKSCFFVADASDLDIGTHNTVMNDVDPDFSEAITNVTVPVGREAVLSCSVTDLGHFKVPPLRKRLNAFLF